jgi:hypothetical protein
MATQLYLSGVSAITGGVLDLNGANIQLLPGWRPRVAKRRRGVLGGKRHEDVVESIPLRVFGASAADCVQFLELLAAAMDQARDWKDGAAVDAVILNYAIDGTTLANPLQTAVWGTPMDAADILSLPVEFNRHLRVFEVNPVTLPLERRGEWLGDEESGSATAVEVGNIASIDFGSDARAVVSLLADIDTASGTVTSQNFEPFYLFCSNPSKLVHWQPSALSPFTSVADAGNRALGGTVLRYTPIGTIEALTASHNVSTAGFAGCSAFMFVVCKNNSATTNFTMRGIVFRQDPSQYNLRSATRPATIFGGDTDRQIVPLGIVSLPVDFQSSILGVTASAASGTFDIDDIIMLGVDRNSSIIGVSSGTVPGGGSVGAIDNYGYRVEHRLLTDPKPIAAMYNTSAITFGSPENDLPSPAGSLIVRMDGSELSVLVVSVDETNNYWRWYDGGSSNVIRTTVTATRRPAYLVPR